MYSTTVAVGRLTKDPIIKAYSSGQGELALFTIAVNRTKDKTDFYECVTFGKTAEMVKTYLSNGKGRLVLVEGNFQNNNNERDINGTKVTNYGMNLAVNRIQFLDSPKQEGTAAPQQAQQSQSQGYRPQPTSSPSFQQPAQPTYQAQQQSKPAQAPYQAPYQQAPQAPSTPDPFTQAPGFTGFDMSNDDLPF